MTQPKENPRSIERRFAKALDSEIVESGSRDYRMVAARLRRLERSSLSGLPKKSFATLEVKRRIAEQIFYQALSHSCSWTVCQAKYRALYKVGFTNLERKADFDLLYARDALSRGKKTLAQKTAATIVREMESATKRGSNPLRKKLLDLNRALLLRIEQQEPS